MKAIHLLFLILFILSIDAVNAQKPPIDSAAIASWPELHASIISNDGRYFLYTIENSPVGAATLVVRPTHKEGGEKRFLANSGEFTPDSKKAIISLTNDTLAIYDFETGNTRKMPGIASHTLSAKGWLACLDTSKEGRLMLYDQASGPVRTTPGVSSYSFDPPGNRLLIEQKISTDTTVLSLFDPSSGRIQMIYQGSNVQKTLFDDTGGKVAFFTNSQAESTKVYIYYLNDNKLQLLADDHTAGIGDNAMIDVNEWAFFNHAGDRLFFHLKVKTVPQPKPGYIKVNVWNYKDGMLQPMQMANYATEFLAVANLDRQNVVQIEDKDRMLVNMFDYGKLSSNVGDYVLVSPLLGTNIDYRIKIHRPYPELYRLSLVDGSLSPVKLHIAYSQYTPGDYFNVSPGGLWFLYFNMTENAWYSYEMSTGKTVNLTGHLPVNFADHYLDDGPTLPNHRPAEHDNAWTSGDSAVLICDTYDTWKIDPSGNRRPVNLTGGYGLKHHIRFRLAESMDGGQKFLPGSELLLTAFDPQTKYSGFYKVSMNKPAEPELLIMGPYSYANLVFQTWSAAGRYCFVPVKARDTSVWIVGRCSATQAPNFYLTSDFKNLQPLTDFEPQKLYNWMTSELVNWKLPDGRMSQGVLFKPENFDPKKKYPVIFKFYWRLSDECFLFINPAFDGGQINVPDYVSKGYLVFEPDIHYKANEPGPSIVASIESAVAYLEKTRPYIDSTKMAINGESWGGYEVNYLVTHTHNFAAAVDGFGVSDIISDYGSLINDGAFAQRWRYEGLSGYYHMDVNPWQRPDIYIRNSPVLSANKVTTPLLIQHNEKDKGVLFPQGLELFNALWELGKPAWMLQYDNGGHGVYGVGGEDAIDFSKRLAQFFDYYLKGALPPVWMTRGVPASLKGIDSGLEYDTSDAKP